MTGRERQETILIAHITGAANRWQTHYARSFYRPLYLATKQF